MQIYTLALLRWRLQGMTGPEHRALQVPIRGKRWCRLARSLSLLSRLPTIPTPRRIHGLSEIQPPARNPSKCRYRRRKPRDNLPMRFLHWRTACVARLHDARRQLDNEGLGVLFDG